MVEVTVKKEASSGVLFFAGALSGICEAFAVQPFDMVKTRHQLNTTSNAGVFRTLHNIYKEGGVRLWYRGMSAELVGMVPKSSAMYATYALVEKCMVDKCGFERSMAVSWFSGLIAGIPEAVIVTPFQIIKVRLQALEHVGKYDGPVDCATKLFRNEGGFKPFCIGLTPTLFRNCIFNSMYFGIMYGIRTQFPEKKNSSKFTQIWTLFVSGFIGAVSATCFNAPFDVVKSRFQSQTQHVAAAVESHAAPPPLRYRGVFQTLSLVLKEEGWKACYKGFAPKAMRMGLGGAVAMCTFELITDVMS